MSHIDLCHNLPRWGMQLLKTTSTAEAVTLKKIPRGNYHSRLMLHYYQPTVTYFFFPSPNHVALLEIIQTI